MPQPRESAPKPADWLVKYRQAVLHAKKSWDMTHQKVHFKAIRRFWHRMYSKTKYFNECVYKPAVEWSGHQQHQWRKNPFKRLYGTFILGRMIVYAFGNSNPASWVILDIGITITLAFAVTPLWPIPLAIMLLWVFSIAKLDDFIFTLQQTLISEKEQAAAIAEIRHRQPLFLKMFARFVAMWRYLEEGFRNYRLAGKNVLFIVWRMVASLSCANPGCTSVTLTLLCLAPLTGGLSLFGILPVMLFSFSGLDAAHFFATESKTSDPYLKQKGNIHSTVWKALCGERLARCIDKAKAMNGYHKAHLLSKLKFQLLMLSKLLSAFWDVCPFTASFLGYSISIAVDVILASSAALFLGPYILIPFSAVLLASFGFAMLHQQDIIENFDRRLAWRVCAKKEIAAQEQTPLPFNQLSLFNPMFSSFTSKTSSPPKTDSKAPIATFTSHKHHISNN